jgi:hypothetical protein
MKTIIIIGIFVLFLVSVQFGTAKTVDEVIDKYMAARGGKEKLNSIKSIYMEGSRETMGNKVKILITKEQDKLSRTQFEKDGGVGFDLITKTAAWKYSPSGMYAAQQMPDEMIAAFETEMDIAGPLVDYAAKGHTTELMGKENIDDITCFKIKLTTKAGKGINYWIRSDNYLLLQSTSIETDLQNTKPIFGKTLIVYRDYKAVDGALFAHLLEKRIEGGEMQGSSYIAFNKIAVNNDVDKKLYQPV